MAQPAKDIKVSTTDIDGKMATTNVVAISPHIGIGDLLIYKSIALNENLHFKFHLKQSMVDKYRNASTEYKTFVEQLLDILKIPYVWDEKCTIAEPDQLLNTYGIKNTNILHDIFPYKESNIMGDYIVIHTKCRLNRESITNNLRNFFKSFRAGCGIVLLGERKATENFENRLHGVTCIYNELLALKSNNTVIDFTVDDVQNKPDIKLFLRDINLIRGARCNILLGIGGNFVMSTLLGKSSITYIGTTQHPYIKSFEKSKDHNIIRSIDEFTQKINKLVEPKQPIVAELPIVTELPSEARLIKRWQLINAKEDEELKKYKPICPICKYDGDFKQRIANDIFHAGQLIRYECPQCDVIFGARKMLQLSDEEFAKDYFDVYSYYREGDTSSSEEHLFYLLKPEKNKLYLLYGCRNEVMIIKFRSLGYKVYGFDPFVNKNQYILTSREDLLKHKFDGIISNNVIEHLRDPVSDLLFMKSILMPGSKMIHATECYVYMVEITHYHLFFFVGRSVDVLSAKTGLIGEVHRQVQVGVYNSSYAVFTVPQEKTDTNIEAKKQDNILVFGDPHSCIYKYVKNPEITTIVNHVGPVTMHRIGRDGADGFIAKHFTSTNKPIGVMAVFGEIDVRCHVGKIMDREKKSEDEVTITLCDAYIKALQEVEKKYTVKIIIQSVVPPSDISYAHIANHEFAAYSKVDELIKYTISVNKLLKAACDKLNWVFVDVYKSFVGANGILIAGMSDGNVHINDAQWPLVSKIFNDAYSHNSAAPLSLFSDSKVKKEPTK